MQFTVFSVIFGNFLNCIQIGNFNCMLVNFLNCMQIGCYFRSSIPEAVFCLFLTIILSWLIFAPLWRWAGFIIVHGLSSSFFNCVLIFTNYSWLLLNFIINLPFLIFNICAPLSTPSPQLLHFKVIDVIKYTVSNDSWSCFLLIRATAYLDKIVTQPIIEKCDSYLSIGCDNFIAKQGVTSCFQCFLSIPKFFAFKFFTKAEYLKNKPT